MDTSKNPTGISHLLGGLLLAPPWPAMGSRRPLDRRSPPDSDSLVARLRRLEQDNARLLERERTRLEETRALAGIGRLLSERLEPAVVGARIAESLRSLVGGGAAVVYRLDGHSGRLEALAVSGTSNPATNWRPCGGPRPGAPPRRHRPASRRDGDAAGRPGR